MATRLPALGVKEGLTEPATQPTHPAQQQQRGALADEIDDVEEPRVKGEVAAEEVVEEAAGVVAEAMLGGEGTGAAATTAATAGSGSTVAKKKEATTAAMDSTTRDSTAAADATVVVSASAAVGGATVDNRQLTRMGSSMATVAGDIASALVVYEAGQSTPRDALVYLG